MQLSFEEESAPVTCSRILPVGGRIIFRPDPPKTHEGRFLLPERNHEQATTGTVVDAGRGKWHEGVWKPWEYSSGDRVLCSRYRSQMSELTVTLDGVEHLLVSGDKVLFRLPLDGKALPQPIGARVMVKMKERRIESKLIIIPDSAQKEESIEATVVSLGTGETGSDGKKKEFPIQVGDAVVCNKWVGVDCSIGGDQFSIYKSEDVAAIKIQ